jgi:hypothetical protein
MTQVRRHLLTFSKLFSSSTTYPIRENKPLVRRSRQVAPFRTRFSYCSVHPYEYVVFLKWIFLSVAGSAGSATKTNQLKK